ncbi:type VI secretion system tip protein VgrG [Pseudomonas sp. TNT2022 ID681]|uniref:Type VI secretion system tip protein VgrG n=1 Tax=Pseudomonas fontis TaxID=2942633 RepID=A0ABT5NZ00_9PSED|nr:type VI secretion system tip protein VgrG [Pseudomonas fontis]
MRVSQGWAGGNWGSMAIPRIGQEVIVNYENSDPDLPIITGRTYCATQPPPYELPKHRTRMTLKSQTHKGVGFNELRFEDELGHEEVFIHAQKDQNIKVNHDDTHTVGNDQRIAVGRDRSTTLGQDDSVTTGRDRREHIQQDAFTTVERNQVLNVGNSLEAVIASSHSLKIGEHQTLVIEGVQSIEAKTAQRTLTREYVLQGTERILIRGPNGKIVMDTAGITLEAPDIMLKGNVVIVAPSEDQVEAIDAAIREGSPLIEECPFAKEGKA